MECSAERLAEVREMCASGRARRIRQAAKLSLSEVAEDLGVTFVTISRWELGKRSPRGEAALQYLDLLQRLYKMEVMNSFGYRVCAGLRGEEPSRGNDNSTGTEHH